MNEKALKIEQTIWKKESVSLKTKIEMILVEEERELRCLKTEEILQELSVSFRKGNIRIMGITEEEREVEWRVYLKKE